MGIAAYNGHTEVVKLLLSHPGCDVDGRDDQGCTALWQAARNGRTQALRLLLAAAADPSIPGEQGWLAIDVAREKDRTECISLLEGEERAYILSKARRLWREEQLLTAALEQGRILEPEEVPPHLVGRLLLRAGGAGSPNPLARGRGPGGGSAAVGGPGTVSRGSSSGSTGGKGGAAGGGGGGGGTAFGLLETGMPRVETEEEDEHGAKSRSRDDASAAAQYVVEHMRFDVFVVMRDLLALSSSTPAPAFPMER